MADTAVRYPTSKRLKTPAATTSTKAQFIYRKMLADIALLYYNGKNGTEFELVEDETLDACSFTDFNGSWSHCSFNAKDSSSINEFFAEIQHFNPPEPFVTTCKILIKGSTKVGCENCKSVTHPMSDDDEMDWKHDKQVVGNYKMPDFATYDPISPKYKPSPVSYPMSFNMATHFDNVHLANTRIANRALDHYNKTHGTKFVLVDDETLRGNRFSETWIHTCFNAKDSSIKQCNAEDSHSPIKLFFAEIMYSRVSMPAVTNCQIVEGKTKRNCESCNYGVFHPVEGYRRELPDNTQIVEEDSDYCNKVYDVEFLYKGSTKVGCEYCKSLTHPMSDNDAMDWKHDKKVVGNYKMPDFATYDPISPKYKPSPVSYPMSFNMATHFDNVHLANTRIANRALDHYNKTHGTKFVLVDDETLRGNRFSETWIHTCFNAKDSSIKQCNAEDSHSPIKLFFAEIMYSRVSMPAVTNCQIVEGKTKRNCESCNYGVFHPVEGYRRELPDNTQIVEEDSDYCNKVYDVEFLYKGSTKVGCEYCKSLTHPMSDNDAMDWKHDKKVVGNYKMPDFATYDPISPKYKPSPVSYPMSFNMATHFDNVHLANTRIANRALDHYNKTHGTKFVLVDDETLRGNRFSETWIHTCFNAKDSSIKQCNAEDSHSPIKLFFAEIMYSRVSMPAVTNCQIVEGKTKRNCESCNYGVFHPVEGYRRELPDNTQIVEEDSDYCNKVYDVEFLYKGDGKRSKILC